MAARSHDLVAIDRCPITVPDLHRAPAVAEALSAPLGHGRKPLDVGFTATEAGLDVDIRGHGPAAEGVRAALVRLASDLPAAERPRFQYRAADNPRFETAVRRRENPPPPTVSLGGASVCDVPLAVRKAP